MMDQASVSGAMEDRLGEIVFAYVRAQEEGHAPAPEQWLASYPEYATELAAFLEDQAQLEQLAKPLREVGRAAWSGSSVLQEAESTVAGTEPAPVRAVGRCYGDYEVVEEIARGGMGVVYKARQKSLNRLVALKVIRAGELASAADVQRFRQEAETIALLDHPHIVPVYEVGEQDGQVFFAMKLIEGGRLADRAGNGMVANAEQRRAARLVATVARAIHHAHQRGVLHRDLKPSNILLDRQGQPHVTDFGLAKRVHAERSLTQSGVVLGTPSYMAPEQARGDKGQTTTATDIYGLGAVLYTLLTGRPPFQGQTVLETLEQMQEREPEPPRRRNPALARDLETICLKCLQKAPAHRYASAEALADDLQCWFEDRPIQARRPSLATRLGRLWQQHTVLIGAAATVLLALGTLVIILAKMAYDRATQQAALAFEVLTALQKSAGWQHQGRLPEALEEAERANRLLAGTDANAGLVEQARARLADLRLVDRLQEIRLIGAARFVNDGFDTRVNNPLYQRAFLAAGLDVEANPDQTATRIRASSVPVELADALDEWALARRSAAGPNDVSWKNLLHVASLVDPDPWRMHMREALSTGDSKALQGLLIATDVTQLTPQTLAAAFSALVDDSPTDRRVENTLLAAQRRYPDDFWINTELFCYYHRVAKPWHIGQAMRSAAVAVAIRPRSAPARLNLGYSFSRQGHTTEAVAEYREALRLDPELGAAHSNLGRALAREGRMKEAITECRKAVRSDPTDARFHNNLGSALASAHQRVEAVAEYREALRLNPKAAEVHDNLACVLAGQGHTDEAVAEFQAAIRLRSDWAAPHMKLGTLLLNVRGAREAIPEYRAAVQLDKDNAETHYNLGVALDNAGQQQEAAAQYAAAIQIQNDFPEAHCNLARLLQRQGRFHQAVNEYRRGNEQGARKPQWAYPSAQWLREAETMARLDDRLDDYLTGRLKPANAEDQLKLAQLCARPFQACYAASARWYAQAFGKRASLADDPNAQHRYNAACAAALAGCGKGKDVNTLSSAERGRLRQQAHAWLRADVRAYRVLLNQSARTAVPVLAQRLQHWLKDEDLAGVRGEAALAKLPEVERAGWRKLWADVAVLLAKARSDHSSRTSATQR